MAIRSVTYKSDLQKYARKAAIEPPVYKVFKEDSSPAFRYKAIVILNNIIYESPHGFAKLKCAERAAAKVALDRLSQSSGGVIPTPVFLQQGSGLCKSLLQEYAQKSRLRLPVYQSQMLGKDAFTSIVEIAGVKYNGFAKSEKLAEFMAASTALLAIQAAQSLAGTVVHVTAPQPHVAIAPGAPVGLATLISTHLNNAPGKKRTRGSADAIPDEVSAGRLKSGPPDAQLHVKVTAKGIVQAGSLG